MTIRLRAFAGAREVLGGESTLELPVGATCGSAWELLRERHEALRSLPLKGLAVNREYVSFEHELADGDELAVIPPVSGG